MLRRHHQTAPRLGRSSNRNEEDSKEQVVIEAVFESGRAVRESWMPYFHRSVVARVTALPLVGPGCLVVCHA